MPQLSTKNYTTGEMTNLEAAFSFLNEDGSDATAAQIEGWIERQVRGKAVQHFDRIEGAKASAAARTSAGNI